MKLSQYKKDYHEFSGKASDVTRQLAFAGVAVIWIFKIGGAYKPQIPTPLLMPLALLVSTLAFDLLQYVVSAIIWGIFYRYNESKLKNLSEDPMLFASRYLNWPGILFFFLKIATVIIAYGLLIRFFWRLWLPA